MSLASRLARAEQLRSELTSLTVEREAALQGKNDELAEAKLDAEIGRLESEVELAKARNESETTGGSVDDALAAMRAAATEGQPAPTEPEAIVQEDQPTETPTTLAPPFAEASTTDTPKADGE